MSVLSPEERTLVLLHIRKKQKGRMICPVCGKTDWVLDEVTSMLAFDNGVPDISSARNSPMIVLICNNCAFIRQFAWTVLKKVALDAE